MPIARKAKWFKVTADQTNFLANDEVLGNAGPGLYRIWIKGTVGDGTFTVRDGQQTIIDAWPIPAGSAAATYPSFNRREDLFVDVRVTGNATHLPIDISDGTDSEIFLYVEKL